MLRGTSPPFPSPICCLWIPKANARPLPQPLPWQPPCTGLESAAQIPQRGWQAGTARPSCCLIHLQPHCPASGQTRRGGGSWAASKARPDPEQLPWRGGDGAIGT